MCEGRKFIEFEVSEKIVDHSPLDTSTFVGSKIHQPSSSFPPCRRLEQASLPERAGHLTGRPKQRLGGEPGDLLSMMTPNIQNWGLSLAHARWDGTGYRLRVGEAWRLLCLILTA